MFLNCALRERLLVYSFGTAFGNAQRRNAVPFRNVSRLRTSQGTRLSSKSRKSIASGTVRESKRLPSLLTLSLNERIMLIDTTA